MLKKLALTPLVFIITEVKTKNNWNMKFSEFNIDRYELNGNDLDVNNK